MNATQMDPMSREILINPNFDFSTITWEDMVTMTTFWRHRFAKPGAACRAWISLLSDGNNLLFNRVIGALLAISNGSSTNDSTAFGDIFTHEFATKNRSNVLPLEDFDEVAASKQHGHWPSVALNYLKDQNKF